MHISHIGVILITVFIAWRIAFGVMRSRRRDG
jgi:hypothetical protein